MSKFFTIGDIHGCSKPLAELLEKIAPLLTKDDTIIFIGDYIDRGPDSKGVIDIVLELRKKHKRVITLMGNHESMFMGALQGYGQKEFLRMGGEATLKSYGIDKDITKDFSANIPPDHLAFFLDLMPYWETEEYIFVHAGLQPGVHLTQQSPDWLFWARDEFIETTYDFKKKVIYGHTPFDTPKVDSNKIGIDTGLVYGNTITCLILPEMKFIAVENKE